MEGNSALDNCPQCNSELPPPLKSGRQICKNCGWASAAKKLSQPSSKPAAQGGIFKILWAITTPINKAQTAFRTNKIFRYAVIWSPAALLAVIIGSAGISYRNAQICKANFKEHINPLFLERQDAIDRVFSGNRSNMLPHISDLQKIKRRAANADWPGCSFVARKAFFVGLGSDISQFLDFAGGKDISYRESFSWEVFESDRKRILDSGKPWHQANSTSKAKEKLLQIYEEELGKLDKLAKTAEEEKDSSQKRLIRDEEFYIGMEKSSIEFDRIDEGE